MSAILWPLKSLMEQKLREKDEELLKRDRDHAVELASRDRELEAALEEARARHEEHVRGLHQEKQAMLDQARYRALGCS